MFLIYIYSEWIHNIFMIGKLKKYCDVNFYGLTLVNRDDVSVLNKYLVKNNMEKRHTIVGNSQVSCEVLRSYLRLYTTALYLLNLDLNDNFYLTKEEV